MHLQTKTNVAGLRVQIVLTPSIQALYHRGSMDHRAMVHRLWMVHFGLKLIQLRSAAIMMIRERPTLYEWKSVGDANVEFQLRTSSSGTEQGFKLRLRFDRK